MGSTGKTKPISGGSFAIKTSSKQEQEQEKAQNQKSDQELEKQIDDEIEYVNQPTHDANDLEGVTVFPNNNSGPSKWFKNPKLSNYEEWESNLTGDESTSLSHFLGSGSGFINSNLYDTPWSQLTDHEKEDAINIYNAMNKFELNKAIQTVRATNVSEVFGWNAASGDVAQNIKNILSNTDNVWQFNGFQSTSTGTEPVFSGDFIIHYTIPPSKGAGAYTQPISTFHSEREFTLNNNAVVQFDPNSVYKDDIGRIHINATWLGQAKNQAFKKKKNY